MLQILSRMENEVQFSPVSANIFSAVQAAPAKYDFRAKQYDWLVGTDIFNLLHWNIRTKHLKEFAGKAILSSQGQLLDIGCGSLTQTANHYLHSPNRCILLDQSVNMLRVGESRLTKNGRKSLLPNLKLIQADAFNLPFAKEHFDVLCSFGTLHLFDDKRAFLQAVLPFLKVGGEFYFLVMTNKYLNSRLFMGSLRFLGEFGKVCSPPELLALFDGMNCQLEWYMKGSVLFIKGKKL